MTTGAIVLKGVVNGTTVELDHNPGLPNGQEVTVTLRAPTQARHGRPPGEGLRRSAGAWADDIEGLDQYLEWSRQQRKRVRWGREQTS